MPERKKQISLKQLHRRLNTEKYDRTGFRVVAQLYGTTQRFAVVEAGLDEGVRELVLDVVAEEML